MLRMYLYGFVPCAAICPQGCRNGGICMAPGICSCPEGWLGGACHTGELTPIRWHAYFTSIICLVSPLLLLLIQSLVTLLVLHSLGLNKLPNCRMWFKSYGYNWGDFLVVFQMWLSSHTSHLLVSRVSKSLNTTLFHLGCSCVHSPLPEWRKVYFSQQVPLPPPFLRPSLRGEEKVPLVWPCWGRRLMRSNKGLYADKDHVVLTETLLNSCWRSIGLFSFDCKIQPCTVL